MKKGKRLLAISLSLLLLLPLAACGAGGPPDSGGKNLNGFDFYGGGSTFPIEADRFDGLYPETPDGPIENNFISASEAPVSTFSADVDTASYTYFRKMVNGTGGNLSSIIELTKGAIRTEEMINYFNYNYVGPAQGELFGVNASISDCPWNGEAVLMCLGLKAATVLPEGGNNLVFLIDVSGSMGATDKLALLKTAFSYLTGQLTERDVVSIVTYAGKEEVVLEGCEGNLDEKIQRAVNSLVASGSTNGQAGLQKAYDIAKKYYIAGGNNRIIMASDGDLNVGISSPEQLKEFVAEKREAGIYLSVLGFGTGNYRDANMEALAQNGNGVYYYIDGESEAEKIFSSDLLSTLYTVAEDVKLQITFDPKYIDSYRLVGYENRLLAEEDFNDDTKDAGEVGAGHSVTVCYELKLTGQAAGKGDWMKLAVRHKNPGKSESILREYSIGSAEHTQTPGDNFKFICALAEFSMLLRRSAYLGDIGVGDILKDLEALDLDGDYYKSEFREIVRSLAA